MIAPDAVKPPVVVIKPDVVNVFPLIKPVVVNVVPLMPQLSVIYPVDVKVPVCVVVEGEKKFPIANVVEVGSKDVILKAGQVKIFDN